MTTESQQSRIHASIIREIIRALEPSVENKDSHIKELQVKPILEKGIRDLERSLEIKTSRIRALKSSLESKDSRIKELQSAKLTSLQRIRELQHSLKIKDNRIKGLEAANLTLDASDKRHAVERIKVERALLNVTEEYKEKLAVAEKLISQLQAKIALLPADTNVGSTHDGDEMTLMKFAKEVSDAGKQTDFDLVHSFENEDISVCIAERAKGGFVTFDLIPSASSDLSEQGGWFDSVPTLAGPPTEAGEIPISRGVAPHSGNAPLDDDSFVECVGGLFVPLAVEGENPINCELVPRSGSSFPPDDDFSIVECETLYLE